MKTNESQVTAFSTVLGAKSDVFTDLVELSGLRPAIDFQHSRLSGVDFAESDLSGFKFDYADLRGVKWENRSSDPVSLRYSLRGNGADEVRGSDFAALYAKVMSKTSWAERFFAFKILVDNWGENSDTAEVLQELLAKTRETYLPLCSFIYFSASYLDDNEAKTWCVSMANAGSSQANIFRLRKLRQLAKQNAKYFESVELRPRYPNDLTESEIRSLRNAMLRVADSSYEVAQDEARYPPGS
ncbi:pentapeptide repeat-containing protein [Roseobacter litoralis]|uniref:pentapeptide repeat-containing protein n=1 Tax=Roseobacter litoralis TaxID=42443 RepID=UPI0024940870|nr:pentapeptide repeat-containing protein [Roseobacter litoralis]